MTTSKYEQLRNESLERSDKELETEQQQQNESEIKEEEFVPLSDVDMKSTKAIKVVNATARTSTTKNESKAVTAAIAATVTKPNKPWIRGVNLGGWLVLERYIVPYQFAVTDCHIRGDLCWYPGAISAPANFTDAQVCDLHQCHPHRTVPVHDTLDYPVDEWTLGKVFLDAHANADDDLIRPAAGIAIAERWFNTHFENFITEQDIAAVAAAGATHVRVPLPHFVLGDVLPNELWIVGNRWDCFIRMCHLARQYNLQVWPDLHTAPGSQNGFDNSGQQNNNWATCSGWSNNVENVNRTLHIIDMITRRIVDEHLHTDVVTGFGLLNEPFKDCNRTLYEEFMEQGKRIVRTNLGEQTSIYVSDMFLASTFNNGHWWLNRETSNEKNVRSNGDKENIDENVSSTNNSRWNDDMATTKLSPPSLSQRDLNPYHDTYLDSHYYQVFDSTARNFTPAQHIAYTCQQQYRDSVSCCYEKDTSLWAYLTGRYGQDQSISSNGIRRIVGEWSAAYDTLPVDKLNDMMDSIAMHGVVIEYDRQLNDGQKAFLVNFVQAQMVVYESQQVGISEGWFYWTVKMEGGAFSEWDFLRGIYEKWIPIIPPSDVSSESILGSCYDILLRTNDTDAAIADVVHTYPIPDSLPSWSYSDLDDDVVVTHGQSLIDKNGHYPLYPRSPLVHNRYGIFGGRDHTTYYYGQPKYPSVTELVIYAISICLVIFIGRFVYRNSQCHKQKRHKYDAIPNHIELEC